ncbi:MAG TPA: PAS domain-containing sensor histidine kinase, partial [Salinivirga sp.]|uniref:sensor histidine kinase n=1 Tax=Salinivirga sp. TaxID=1970192 RepID=UPI002B470067
KSSDWIWVIDRGKVIEYDDKGNPSRAIGTHINITHQKQIEERLRELNNTKDKLFSIIAHDLRSPIGTMMNIAELTSMKKLDENALSRFFESQKDLTKNTFFLLENLLYWARHNSNKEDIKPNIIDFSIKEIIDETLLQLNHEAKNKNLSVLKDDSDDFKVTGDIDMIRLVFRNLLTNAIKYTKKDGTIHIGLEKINGRLAISIKDTGIGIKKKHIEKILLNTEFHTTQGTNNEKGTGLGLKLVQTFINKHGGELKISSKPGKGSTFRFTLPLAR